MKVPTLQSNRVSEQQGQLGYAQVPSNLGAGWQSLASGLRALGGAFSQYEAQLKERDEKTNRFNALTALNDFESETDLQQTELKRNADPSGKDFAKTATQLYDKRAEEFLSSKIPEDLREEFRYRLSENRQRALNDAYDFQYKAGDAWFRKGVEEQLTKAGNAVGQDPNALEIWQKKMDEVISATDLSEIEKADLREKVNINLAGIVYYQKVKESAIEAQDAGVTDFSDEFEATKALIRKEEGFSPNSYYDTNAERIGYGTDTITRDGKHIPVRKGDRVTREEAEADLEYRLQEREGKAVRGQLGDQWATLPNNVKAALYSVGYNYGSLPSSVVKAVKSGDTEAIAQSIENLSANKVRRRREAAIVRGSAAIDMDEKFAGIPFDDKVRMRSAAEREAKAEYNEQLKLLTQQQENARNELYTGLFDGKMNELDITKARESGILVDIDHIEKAHKILKDRTDRIEMEGGFNEILTSGRPYDPTDDDQKKMYNAWVGPNGLNKLASGDKEYFNQVIKPAYEQVGAMAPDVAGMFQGMMRSGSDKLRMFAIDALSQLQDSNPTAFASQIPEALQKQVDYWDARKGLVDDPTDLLRNLDGGKTQEERQRRLTLRKEAESILARREAGVPKIDEVMKEVLENFDQSWFSSPEFSAIPERKLAMQQEFQTLFTDAYEMYGTVEESTAAAVKVMKQSWGISPVGRGVVMKYGPDKAMYKPGADGTYNWIDQEIRQDFNIVGDTEYELVSDDITRQDLERFKREGGNPPSYRVMLRDANGVWRDPAPGERVFFKKPAELIKKEAAELDWRNEKKLLENRWADIVSMKHRLNAAKPGESLPEEILEEEKDIKERLGILDNQINPAPADTFEMPPTDAMGNVVGGDSSVPFDEGKKLNPDIEKLSGPEQLLLKTLRGLEGMSGTSVKLFNDIVQRGRKEPITEKDFSEKERAGLKAMIEKKIAATGKSSGNIDYKDYLGSGVSENILGGFKFKTEDGQIIIEDIYDFNKNRAGRFDDSTLAQLIALGFNTKQLAASIGRKLLSDESKKGIPVKIKLGGN